MKTLRAQPVPVTRHPGQGSPDGDNRSTRSAVMRYLSSAALVVPRGTPWRELTGHQRAALVGRGVVQSGLLAAALRDLRRRPADEIRGRKALWVLVSGVNYLGIGPLAYFAFGRRRSPASQPDATPSGRAA